MYKISIEIDNPNNKKLFCMLDKKTKIYYT